MRQEAGEMDHGTLVSETEIVAWTALAVAVLVQRPRW
jgi:hypothetical protein